LKTELLKNRFDNDFVFIGSSRTQDSLDSNFVARWFFENRNVNIKAFNGGTPRYNYFKFRYFIKEAFKIDHSKKYILEVSGASLKNGEFSRPNKNPYSESDFNGDNFFPIEQKLQSLLYKNLWLVKVRKSLSPKIIFRLFMLWSSDSVVHDIWFRSGTLRQLTRGWYKKNSDVDLKKFSTEKKPLQEFDLSSEEVFSIKKSIPYVRLKKVLMDVPDDFEKSGLIFFRPPLRGDAQKKACDVAQLRMLYLFFSEHPEYNFLDYACLNFPKSFFRDPKHLNPEGRVFFSQVMSFDLDRLFKTSSTSSR
jgi:hypothetical protein